MSYFINRKQSIKICGDYLCGFDTLVEILDKVDELPDNIFIRAFLDDGNIKYFIAQKQSIRCTIYWIEIEPFPFMSAIDVRIIPRKIKYYENPFYKRICRTCLCYIDCRICMDFHQCINCSGRLHYFKCVKPDINYVEFYIEQRGIKDFDINSDKKTDISDLIDLFITNCKFQSPTILERKYVYYTILKAMHELAMITI